MSECNVQMSKHAAVACDESRSPVPRLSGSVDTTVTEERGAGGGEGCPDCSGQLLSLKVNKQTVHWLSEKIAQGWGCSTLQFPRPS